MRNFVFVALAGALTFSCGSRDKSLLDPAPSEAVPNPDAQRYAVPIDGLPSMGARNALVTIVEFTDYDCPFCGKAEHTIVAIRRKYGDDVSIAVAEHPLPMHPHARDAALAALAAAQVAGFEALHPKLFENPDSRSPGDLAQLAVDVGIDRNAFERARDSDAPAVALAQAESLASALHVRGTPTFFINGRKVGGAQPLATFDAVIGEELSRARALVAAGVRRDHVYGALLDDARAHPATFEEDAPEALVPKDIGGAEFLGRANAKTTIALFTDFECPYCKKLDARLREIATKHPDVRVVLRNRPLAMHPHARLAAKAAVAASAQGKLDAYSAMLFEHQDALDRASLAAYANKVGLDVGRFTRDLDSPTTEAAVLADEALATKLDVKGTPTSFIEGRRIVGAQPIATFEETLPQ